MKTPMKRGFFLGILIAMATLSEANSAPMKWQAAPGANATFEAIGKPNFLKIKGHGAKVTGGLELNGAAVTGRFELILNEFDTDRDTRNEHMRDRYLETSKFPKADFAIESVELPKNWKPGIDLKGAKFKGLLTLKGTTKPVSGSVSVSGADLSSEANFSINLSDYPIGVPKYMGITVADVVNISVQIPKFERK